MSEYTTPIGPLFELQRETIKRGVDLLQLPREIRRECYEETMTASSELREQTLAFTHGTIQHSLDVAAFVSPGAGGLKPLRLFVDEVFETVDERQATVMETVDEQYEHTDEELLRYAITQIDILLTLNRRIESQVVTAIEEFEAETTGSEALAVEVETQFERLSNHWTEQLQRWREIEADLETARRNSHDGTASVTADSRTSPGERFQASADGRFAVSANDGSAIESEDGSTASDD